MIAEGSVIASKYLVEARLGVGGMGSVFLAKHLELGRHFAIKVLHPSLVEDATVIARFRREAELAGRLRHDNVVSVVDLGVTPRNEHYLVMEYAPGTTLAELLEPGPMPEARVFEIARQLCDGLQHAHDAGLIHRDFKPDNVIVETLVDGREVARIVDFGVAILRDNARDVDNSRLTTKGIVVGTPRYMAPEQARGGAVDHRADLFSLGLLLYELLAGKPPFEGSGVEVARANVHLPTPVIGVRAPGVRVEPVLEALVYKLLSKNPDDRLPSAKAVREMLDLYMRDRGAAAVLLGVRPSTLHSSGLPAIQQLAAGRSRSANISAAPYAHPLDVPEEAPQPSEPELATPTRRRSLAIAGIVGVVVFVTGIYLSQRSTATPPRAQTYDVPSLHAAAERHDRPEPSSEPAVPPAPPPPRFDIAAETHRKATKAVTPAPPPAPTGPQPSGPAPLAPQPPAARVAAPAPAASAAADRTLTATEIANLYQQTGRELAKLSKTHPELASELWPRYRWIRINDALATPAKRTEAARLLEDVLVRTRGRGSAAN